MAGYLSIGHKPVVQEEVTAKDIRQDRMVEPVRNPAPKAMHAKEDALLRELVKLRIAIQQSRGDELVEDANRERREKGEEYIVER